MPPTTYCLGSVSFVSCTSMKQSAPLLTSAAALILLGAGCGAPKGAPENTLNLQYGQNRPSNPTSTMVDPYATSTETATSTATTTSTVPGTTSSTVTSTTPTKPMTYAFPGILSKEESTKKVRIQTTLGDIVVQVDPTMGPRAASNFVYLVKEGFYNGTIFHRVIPGFMIQGGDPTGTGMGGPGYKFDNDPVNESTYKKGFIAMANAGRNTNGSQFFLMVADYPLPPDYSIFGKIVTGQDVADKIAAVARNSSDRPNEEVKMISVTIE